MAGARLYVRKGVVDVEKAASADRAVPVLIVVTGPPAAGKTTIGMRLAGDLAYPFINKDRIKESLFDTLGAGDREWSKKLGTASMKLLFDMIEVQLEVGKSVVAEANFYRTYDTPRFQALKARFEFDLVQVRCDSSNDVIVGRYLERARSGERHHGHLDVTDVSQIENLKRELTLGLDEKTWDVLGIDGALVQVDTTHFEKFNYEELLGEVKTYVGQDR